MAITGLSMAARAQAVVDRDEAAKVLRMLPLKYPEQKVSLPVPMPGPNDVRIFRVTPCVISVLDYSTRALDTPISSPCEDPASNPTPRMTLFSTEFARTFA
jgi:hypothetical protein